MKVIDLLNKIANGEEVPKKIKYHGVLYIYDNKDVDYYCGDSEEYYNDALLLPHIINTKEFLNDEVEIIEDTPKEDKKLQKIDYHELIKNREAGVSNDTYLACFINSIIDKINKDTN